MERQKERYHLIDGIRGLAILNMVLFHFLYDVFIIYGKNPLWYEAPSTRLWQQMICGTFLFISGYVWKLGEKRNIKRGILLNGYGLLFTLITFLVLPSELIVFGILNFIGCAVLLLALFQKVLWKVPGGLGMAVSFLLFLLCKNIQHGYLGLEGIFQVALPEGLYQFPLLMPFGFPYPGFHSSDYFPILPWFFLYLCGYYCYKSLLGCKLWQRLASFRLPVLSFLGTKSIWIYLLHQPVCMLVCVFLFSFLL